MPVTQRTFENVDFLDEKEREYFAEAHLGHQTKEFLHSPVGRLLHGRAKQALEAAQQKALEIDPDSEDALKQLRRVRQEAAIAQLFMRWCADAIENGSAAEVQLDEYRS